MNPADMTDEWRANHGVGPAQPPAQRRPRPRYQSAAVVEDRPSRGPFTRPAPDPDAVAQTVQAFLGTRRS